jgi:hypothetical protein
MSYLFFNINHHRFPLLGERDAVGATGDELSCAILNRERLFLRLKRGRMTDSHALV